MLERVEIERRLACRRHADQLHAALRQLQQRAHERVVLEAPADHAIAGLPGEIGDGHRQGRGAARGQEQSTRIVHVEGPRHARVVALEVVGPGERVGLQRAAHGLAHRLGLGPAGAGVVGVHGREHSLRERERHRGGARV